MDEFMEGLADNIAQSISGYFTNLQNIFELAQASPSEAINGFPSVRLWEASSSIAQSIGMGVASTIIALFLFFELASLFNRSDTKGWDGIYWIMMVFLKVAVLMTICRNMTVIIGMCFEITSQVTESIVNSTAWSGLNIESNNISQSMLAYYADKGFWDLLWGSVTAWIGKMANGICITLADIICKLRFIEIYVFNAVAPIAFCTFASKEYKNIGVSFIKRLLALGLQGAFIAIVCYMYVIIVNESFSSLIGINGNDITDPISVMIQLIGYSLLMVIALFQTSGWSKSLLQVN